MTVSQMRVMSNRQSQLTLPGYYSLRVQTQCYLPTVHPSTWLVEPKRRMTMRTTHKFGGSGHDADRNDEQDYTRPWVDFVFRVLRFTLSSLHLFNRLIGTTLTWRKVNINSRAQVSTLRHSEALIRNQEVRLTQKRNIHDK